MQAHRCAEGETRQNERQPRVAVPHEADGRADVVLLASAVVVLAGALADASEVEAQHGAAGRARGARQPKHHFVVQRAAEQRMRMADDDRLLNPHILFRSLVQALQTARRSLKEQ